jgi:hypothetical protein
MVKFFTDDFLAAETVSKAFKTNVFNVKFFKLKFNFLRIEVFVFLFSLTLDQIGIKRLDFFLNFHDLFTDLNSGHFGFFESLVFLCSDFAFANMVQ